MGMTDHHSTDLEGAAYCARTEDPGHEEDRPAPVEYEDEPVATYDEARCPRNGWVIAWPCDDCDCGLAR